MPVHSLHIFDRKGKTLYSKRFIKDDENLDPEYLAEQRKLVFGMLFSLREVAASLSPTDSSDGGLHSVRTGAATLYNYESNSGLRFALYVAHGNNNNTNTSNASTTTTKSNNNAKTDDAATTDASVRAALEYIYNELWIQCVTRSPLYRPTAPNADETNFEVKLTAFLRAQPWFR